MTFVYRVSPRLASLAASAAVAAAASLSSGSIEPAQAQAKNSAKAAPATVEQADAAREAASWRFRQAPGWLMTVKAHVVGSPRFTGSDEYSVIAYPTISIRRNDGPEKFGAPDDGISFVVFGDAHWAVGVVGRYQGGRYYDQDRRLYGIRDAKWSVEPGLFGEFWALTDTVRMRGEMRYGINGYNGLIGSVALDYVHRMGPRLVLNAGPRMTVAGSEYMDAYFGVTAQDAAWNASVTPYSPGAGVKSIGVAAAATYRWNDQWSTTVRGQYDRLVGPAGDSPIVRNIGSRDQFTFGASASYTFPLGYAP
ncbi:MAG: MipA/OmpV family protein [Alsobacter sp.]|jgi:outer membrane scaffolding protein for murein synthesis (MipA/OmpV family)